MLGKLRGCALAAFVSLLFIDSLHASNPSLCIDQDPRCHVLGGALRFRVKLGTSTQSIVSGQFSIQYNTQLLEFVNIMPGHDCEPSSPFEAGLFESVDTINGVIHYGVGIALGGTGTSTSTSMACVTFRILGSSPGEVCLFNGPNPFETKLANSFGFPVIISNASSCPLPPGSTGISCDSYVVSQSCVCGSGLPPDCSLLSDDCNAGVCTGLPAQCERLAYVNGACDDENECTNSDECDDGWCIGTNCPDPSLCVTPMAGCFVPGSLARFEIDLGSGQPLINGGQFSLSYDPTALRFVSIEPGAGCDPTSPFSYEVFENVKKHLGQIFYAVGIEPGVGTETTGPATMACVSFVVLQGPRAEVCLFDAGNPQETILSSEKGMPIQVDNADTCHPHRGYPILSCDEVSTTDTCDCGGITANCSPMDSPCSVGVCEGSPASCVSHSINEGLPCDDGYECSTIDLCESGLCRGQNCTNPSLCLQANETCPVVDGLHRIVVQMGDGSPVITSGEFSIAYDPTVLELVSIEPGHSCDPTSPFVLPIFLDVDEVNGVIHFAVGVDLNGPLLGTQGPAALACLAFRIMADIDSDVCIFREPNPLRTALVDDQGRDVEIYNAFHCPLVGAAVDVTCLPVEVMDTCLCDVGVPDCSLLTDACNLGFCGGTPNQCRQMPTNEDGFCDDINPCTIVDKCSEGVCVGTGCASQSLCVDVDESCQVPSEKLVRVIMGAGDPYIVGGEFTLLYDPSVVEILAIHPGASCDPDSPFVMEIFESINAIDGEIFYAVGVELGANAEGTQGPAVLACIEIRLLERDPNSEICLYADQNPAITVLVDRNGFPVYVDNTEDCTEDLFRNPLLSCDRACIPIPTLTTWGTVILALLMLVGGKVMWSGSGARSNR